MFPFREERGRSAGSVNGAEPMTKVKVCGITNENDALLAVDAGAEIIGFIFYPGSRRHIASDAAAAISALLPSRVVKAGVFVNQEIGFIEDTVKSVGLDISQIHGDETPRFCRDITGAYMKAVRVKDTDSLNKIGDYGSDFILLDTFADRQFGGTGRVFDWNLLRRVDLKGKKLFLSGGLNPDNVSEAVRATRPYAVDVCSGVEKTSGIKDGVKLKRFIEEVRIADNSN